VYSVQSLLKLSPQMSLDKTVGRKSIAKNYITSAENMAMYTRCLVI